MSQARDRTLFDAAPDAYFVLDGEVVVEANRAARALLGDSLVGSSVRSVFDDASTLLDRGRLLGEIGRQGRRYEFAAARGALDGLDTVIVRDVTEHRQREELWERYQLLSENAHDIVLFIRRDGAILEANQAAAHAYGYERDQFRRLNIRDLRAPSTREVVGMQMRQAFDSGVVFETLHMRSDGTTFPVEVSSRAAMIGNEPVLMSILRDVSERNAMQARLLHSDRMAAVGTLAAGVAHEINNPLAYAFTNLEVLEKRLQRIRAAVSEVAPEVIADLDVADSVLAIAREGADRVRAIVRDLKTFSRVDDAAPRPLDVRTVLDSCVNMAAAELRHRARLVRDYGDVPPIEATESRLAQVFLNLLVNAAHAVDPQRAAENEIRLVVRAEEDAVVVEVIDNGVGIREDVRARIFDPFVTTKPAGEGTGLGLFISREIVVGLGGAIEVESEIGRGTRMRVRLPAAAHVIASSTPPRKSPTPDGPRERILVIDDEDSIGVSLRRALDEANVVVTASGHEALALLEHDRDFQAILCDIVMPELDGVGVYEAVRTRYPELADRFIFMTGGALSGDTRAFLGTMQGRVIEKPFATEELRTILRRRSAR